MFIGMIDILAFGSAMTMVIVTWDPKLTLNSLFGFDDVPYKLNGEDV